MNDNEIPAVEAVERLMDRTDASGVALLGEGGLLTEVTRAVLDSFLRTAASGPVVQERRERVLDLRLAVTGKLCKMRSATIYLEVPTDRAPHVLAEGKGDFAAAPATVMVVPSAPEVADGFAGGLSAE
ncbi:hypothetical protein ACFVTP_32655 [Streptomyces celluloflavus]|uniref:hypothetical protein n=1 Tax=Streptomyces celluloflavus TaxID=58344 RepID=UPI0036D86429